MNISYMVHVHFDQGLQAQSDETGFVVTLSLSMAFRTTGKVSRRVNESHAKVKAMLEDIFSFRRSKSASQGRQDQSKKTTFASLKMTVACSGGGSLAILKT